MYTLPGAPWWILAAEDSSSLQVISQLRFPSRRLGNRAIQAVRITPPAGHERAFTFCLERVEVGPYKVCCRKLVSFLGACQRSPRGSPRAVSEPPWIRMRESLSFAGLLAGGRSAARRLCDCDVILKSVVGCRPVGLHCWTSHTASINEVQTH